MQARGGGCPRSRFTCGISPEIWLDGRCGLSQLLRYLLGQRSARRNPETLRMKTSLGKILTLLAACLLPFSALAQVNSGSDGHDGALNPTSNLVINMADHPDGIYHYTSVNIPAGVTVSFIPNAGNKPVVWLVQSSVTIAGNINLSGNRPTAGAGAAGGPGGYRGGVAISNPSPAGVGQGPGGGNGSIPYQNPGWSLYGGNASFATVGGQKTTGGATQAAAGDVYGNIFLLPLVGGSGGGGGVSDGGCGGGGAFLIAASSEIVFSGGQIIAQGAGVDGGGAAYSAGAGSGGSVRLVSQTIRGTGSINVMGGYQYWASNTAGEGRVRLDAMENSLVGGVSGQVTRGFQPIIIPPANQAVSLAIQSVGGVAVAASPTGQLTTPDVVVPANQQNPIPIVVRCTNIPLNTEIIVDVKPANGATVRAVALNTAGTQASSTATVQVNMPRGGGTIQAKAVSGLALTASNGVNEKVRSLAETGWTAEGERFAQVEVTATLGGKSQISYLTESGKRYPVPSL